MGLLFLVLLIGIYALYRLVTDPPPKLEERSLQIGRFLGQPKILDPIFAKALTRRETIGWLVFFLILIAGVLFTQFTGLGTGRHPL